MNSSNKVLSINVGLKEVLSGKIETLEREKEEVLRRISQYNKTELIHNTKLEAIKFTYGIFNLIFMVAVITSIPSILFVIYTEGSIIFCMMIVIVDIIAYIIKNKIKKKMEETISQAKSNKIHLEFRLKQINDEILSLSKERDEIYNKFISKYHEEIEDSNKSQTNEPDMKECPMCAETIKYKARVCRFCNYNF